MREITGIPPIQCDDPATTEGLFALVYQELRQLAAVHLAREKPGQTLQATALVSEAYLRLVGSGHVQKWESRGHFFSAAAESMRRILVENARRKGRQKRGGGARRHELRECDAIGLPPADQVLDLDEALRQLNGDDPRAAELAKLRLFAGLTLEEAAAALEISLRTAKRDWAYARAWLSRALQSYGGSAD